MNIQYKRDALIITAHTMNPAFMHRALLSGINEALRYYIISPEKVSDRDGMLALLDLQAALMPEEKVLEKAY